MSLFVCLKIVSSSKHTAAAQGGLPQQTAALQVADGLHAGIMDQVQHPQRSPARGRLYKHNVKSELKLLQMKRLNVTFKGEEG